MRNGSIQVDDTISEILWKQTNKCIKCSHQHGTLILLKHNVLLRSNGPLAQGLTIYLFSIPALQRSNRGKPHRVCVTVPKRTRSIKQRPSLNY